MDQELNTRLAKVEAVLEHIARGIDKAETQREKRISFEQRTETRLGIIEQQVTLLHNEQMKMMASQSETHDATMKTSTIRAIKEESGDNRRSFYALVVATVAFILSGIDTLVDWVSGAN